MKLRAAQKKADKFYSRYIRLTYADNQGYCTCVTCGVRKHFTELHCGHFSGRRNIATRYDDRNCHPQCVTCNVFNEGRKDRYALYLIKKYGKNVIEELVRKSNKIMKYKAHDYEELADMYKEKVSYLLQEKEL